METIAPTDGLTRTAARFAVDTEPADAALRAAAVPAIVDSIAVMLAGRRSQTGSALARYADSDGSRGSAWTPLLDRAVQPELAAFLNAGLGHSLDYDDALPGSGHLSVPMLSTALAAASASGRALTGQELISAFVIGFEVAAKTGIALGLAHYKRGFHTTITGGTFGATATAARLLGLDTPTTVTAFGIAGSMTSGLMLNFGTTTKPLHSGLAARYGLTAALLARAGATAAPDILEGSGGVLDLYGFGEQRPEALTALGAPWSLLEPGTALKRYPCCYAAARPVDALLQLRAEHGLAADDIAELRCAVPKHGLRPMIHHRPETGLNAKFSMEYVLAAAAIDGRLDLDSFEDDQVQRPHVRALMERVALEEDPALRPEDPQALRSSPATGGSVVVTVTLHDGRSFAAQVAAPVGSPKHPLTTGQLRAKFADCARHGGFDPAAADDVFGTLIDLPSVADVGALVSRLTPSGSAA